MRPLTGAVLLAALAAAGCGSGGAAPPATSAAAAPTPAPGPAQPAAEPAAEPVAPVAAADPQEESDPLTVVIDPGGSSTAASRDLVRAAAAERERRRRTGGPAIVIDDESLADYADVELTIAEGTPAKPEEGEAAAETERRLAETTEAERYWRSRVLEQRLRWRDAVEAVARLEGQVGELRTRFYAEDDPYYRDSRIKPAWDLALSELARFRAEILDAQTELERILREGREFGAMPGWLREGLELEPKAAGAEGGDASRSRGPAIYEPRDPEFTEAQETEGDGDGG